MKFTEESMKAPYCRRRAVRVRVAAYIAAIAAALTLCAFLQSCSGRDGLPVSSVVFELPEKLFPTKYSDKRAEKVKKTTAYAARFNYISIKNDTVFISDTDPTGGDVRSLAAAGGCFTGTVRGISFRTAEGRDVPIVAESCAGLFAAAGGYVAVTVCGGTHIYMLEATTGEAVWNRRTVAVLEGEARAVCLTADGTGILAATGGDAPALWRIGIDGRITKLAESELFCKLEVLSVIEWQGKIYCSTKLGIYCYDPASETELWYRLDI